VKNTQHLPQRSRKIKVTFNGGQLTNFSGILPLFTFMKKLKVDHIFPQMLSLSERPNTQFSMAQVLMSILLGLLCGQNRFTKMESFTHDPLVKRLIHLKKHLDKDTLIGKIKRFGFRQTNELLDINSTLSRKVHQQLPGGEDILDMDSSVHTVYGHQEGARKGFNPQRGKKSYHPLLAFLAGTRECILSWLRPGDAYTANNAVGFLQQVFAVLPSRITSLLVRGDSGFFDDQVLSEIESHPGVTYLIKVKLKNLRSLLSSQEWVGIPEMPQWAMTDFDYHAHGWKAPRHFYALRKIVNVQREGRLFPLYEYEYFCYVCNFQESPLYLHRLYGDRGTSENWIEAVKHQMYAGSLLTQSFWANDALWILSVMAYNLSVWMRLLTDKRSWRQEPSTFRVWFIQLAGKLVNSGRQVYLNLYRSYHEQEKWLRIHHRIESLSFG
jgi:hypothetical protein